MIYVDDMRRWAVPRGGRRRARWSHLFTDQDDQTELHEFAARLGLRRSWFQGARWEATRPWRCHYDVTDSVRERALELGAQPITYPEGMAEMIEQRKARRREAELGQVRTVPLNSDAGAYLTAVAIHGRCVCDHDGLCSEQDSDDNPGRARCALCEVLDPGWPCPTLDEYADYPDPDGVFVEASPAVVRAGL